MVFRPVSSSSWRGSLVPILLLSTVAAARGQEVDARAIGGIGLTVYSDRNYGGESATFREDVPSLTAYGLNDAISSLKAGPGEFWEVCEDSRYRGRCVIVSETEANLGPVGWNDRISSLRRVRDDGGDDGGEDPSDEAEVVLYSSRDFGGESASFDRAVSNLAYGSFNDRARSARITGRWQLCRDSHYRNCVTIDRSASSLQQVGLDRRISSLRPVDGDEGGPSGPATRLVLYDGPDRSGDSRTLTTGTPLLWTFGGRAESALAVGQWQVCTGPNYSGECEIIAGNVDLADWGLANRIFSARPRGR